MHERSGDPRLARALELIGQLDGYRRRALASGGEDAAEEWRRFDVVLEELADIFGAESRASAT